MSKLEITEGLTAVEIFNKVLEGKEIKRFPNHFWEKPHGIENAIEILKYLFEVVLKWTDEDIKKNYDQSILIQHKLAGMHKWVFKHSTYDVINAVYPNRFYEWDLKSVPNKFWMKENGARALKHLFEEVLHWTDEDIKEKFCQQTFYDNGFSGMLKWAYNGSVYDAINSVYPNRFREWDLKHVPMNFWTPEKGIEATRWLYETKLKWSNEEILKNTRSRMFAKYNLGGMLARLYGNSAYLALNAAYPERFKEWQFAHISKNLWNENKAIEATRWLIEKLQWDKEKIEQELTEKTFKNYGLDYMLVSAFGGYSRKVAFSAVKTAYPQIKWNFPS